MAVFRVLRSKIKFGFFGFGVFEALVMFEDGVLLFGFCLEYFGGELWSDLD